MASGWDSEGRWDDWRVEDGLERDGAARTPAGGARPQQVPQRGQDPRRPSPQVPDPRRGRRRSPVGRPLLVGLVVVLLVVVLGVRWVMVQVDPPGAPGAAVAVEVPRATSVSQLGRTLEQAGVITDARLFRLYWQVRGLSAFEAGRYEFRLDQSFDEAIDVLRAGPGASGADQLTVPEGFRLRQIADRLQARFPGRNAQRFLEVAAGGTVRSAFSPDGSTSLEGFLYPETYTVSSAEDDTAILRKLVGAFDDVAAEVGLAESQQKVGISPYEALVVASLIEREAKVPQDRRKIARVIYNRLAEGMRLQIDASVIYGLGGERTRLYTKDLRKDGPYNTYTRAGLPPTPIANPGRAAIEAALDPEPGAWLYYVVVRADGSHAFATTFDEHRRNIAEAARNGVR